MRYTRNYKIIDTGYTNYSSNIKKNNGRVFKYDRVVIVYEM